jgi:ATP-dependent Clp protease ATP-binding subunit ClpA
MLSRELQVTLNLAIQEARKRRHEYLTLEHVLFAMLHDPVALEIIAACGGDREEIKSLLTDFLDESIESLPGSDEVVPEQTLAFQRAVQRAAYHVQSSGKKEMDAGNLLVAM